MKILALISARGGSKGIPRKNIRPLAGKPLIAWSIEAALSCDCITRTVVSTDDFEIAEVAKTYGAEIPFIRPSQISTDETPGIAPVLHALRALPGFDVVVLLQPTSPLRTADDINNAVEMLLHSQANAVVSVNAADVHPYLTYSLDDRKHLMPIVDGTGRKIHRRQDFPEYFALNGAIYAARVPWLFKNQNFLTKETLGYVMTIENSPEIDTELDWRWVEFLLKERSIE